MFKRVIQFFIGNTKQQDDIFDEIMSDQIEQIDNDFILNEEITNDIQKYINIQLAQVRKLYPNNNFTSSICYNHASARVITIIINHNRQYIVFNERMKDSLSCICTVIQKYIKDTYNVRANFEFKMIYNKILQSYINDIRMIEPDILYYYEIIHKQFGIKFLNIYINKKTFKHQSDITKLNLQYRKKYGLYTVPKIIYNNRYDETSSLDNL